VDVDLQFEEWDPHRENHGDCIAIHHTMMRAARDAALSAGGGDEVEESVANFRRHIIATTQIAIVFCMYVLSPSFYFSLLILGGGRGRGAKTLVRGWGLRKPFVNFRI
jgi:hypothetical protein